MLKFLCVSLSSTIQKTILFDSLKLDCVNRSAEYRLDASGKAVNSCRVLNQIEKNCADVICALGKKNKKLFLDLAKNDSMKVYSVSVPGFTRECCTLLDSSKTATELVVGEPFCKFDSEKKEKQVLSIIKSKIKNVDGILLAGSRPLGWSENIYSEIAKVTIEHNKIFFADYWGVDLIKTLSKVVPSIIKINEEEFVNTFCNKDESYFADEKLKAEIINKSKELKNIIIVTRGTKSTLSAQNGIFYETPIKKVDAINVIACGDSFSAGFLYEFSKTHDMNYALEKATYCASKNAESTRPGSII